MKKMFLSCVLLIIITFGMLNCSYNRYLGYEPVYMSYEDLRSSFKVESSSKLQNPGKIYIKDNYIYVNEKNKGIHIYKDDGSSLTEVTFLYIPGNLDICIKDNLLFADSFVDLLVIDISDLTTDVTKIKEVNRMENAFPYNPMQTFSENSSEYYSYAKKPDETKGVVIDWNEVVIEEYSHNSPNYSSNYYGNPMIGMSYSSGGSSIGIAGSMSKMAIRQNYIYALTDEKLNVFKINDLSQDVSIHSVVNVEYGIETLYLYDDKLFIGSNYGVYIYDVSDDPSNPMKVSQLSHIYSYDPVVVQGNYAYSTLRSRYWGSTNECQIISLSDIYNPTTVSRISLDGPYGLGIDNNALFICDGESGLKVYDVSNSLSPKKVNQITTINTYDVILDNKKALIVGDNGIYKYDYTNINNLNLISSIPIEK